MAASTSSSGATNDQQDRLGALPDSILLLILSFVPTLDAVRSSVLSRRWRYLWTSVPILDLDDSPDKFFLERQNHGSAGKRKKGAEVVKENRQIKFGEFVDRVLIFHNTPALYKFRLACRVPTDRYDAVQEWVRVAVTREVRELDLRLQVCSAFKLPPLLFVSQSLVDLKLNLGGNRLKLPAAMGLVGLRSMHLSNVYFDNVHPTRELFSNCAALRSLAMVNCRYHKLSCLEISSPLLQRLTMDTQNRYWGKGLRFCQVNISASQLTFFKYRGFVARAYNIEMLSSLVDVELEFHDSNDSDKEDYEERDEGNYPRQHHCRLLGRVQGLLRQLSCAKSIKICDICVKALSKIPASSPTRSHILFGRLNRLHMKPDSLDNATLCLILRFLVANPALKALALEIVGTPCTFLSCSDGKEEYLKLLKFYSTYTLGVLEEVDIKCKDLPEAVLDLVKILLQNQACLKCLLLNFHLCYATNYSSGSDQEFCSSRRKQLMKVLSFPRRSRNLVVAFL